MKSTGMVRPIDSLGRIVIPKEIRRTFNLKEDDDALEIYVEVDTIILKKYNPKVNALDVTQDFKEYISSNNIGGKPQILNKIDEIAALIVSEG